MFKGRFDFALLTYDRNDMMSNTGYFDIIRGGTPKDMVKMSTLPRQLEI